MAYPLLFGINLAIESVFRNVVLHENFRFPFLFFFEPTEKRFDSNLPEFGVHPLTLILRGLNVSNLGYTIC